MISINSAGSAVGMSTGRIIGGEVVKSQKSGQRRPSKPATSGDYLPHPGFGPDLAPYSFPGDREGAGILGQGVGRRQHQRDDLVADPVIVGYPGGGPGDHR